MSDLCARLGCKGKMVSKIFAEDRGFCRECTDEYAGADIDTEDFINTIKVAKEVEKTKELPVEVPVESDTKEDTRDVPTEEESDNSVNKKIQDFVQAVNFLSKGEILNCLNDFLSNQSPQIDFVLEKVELKTTIMHSVLQKLGTLMKRYDSDKFIFAIFGMCNGQIENLFTPHHSPFPMNMIIASLTFRAIINADEPTLRNIDSFITNIN